MRVGVDARALGGQRGVTRYVVQLLTALAHHPADRFDLFVPGRQDLPAAAAGLERFPGISIHRHPLPGRLLFGAGALTGRPRLDRLIARGAGPSLLDVIWAPTIAPLALGSGVPLVLTVQDLSFAQRPQDFTAYERLWHRLARPRALARRADEVIVLAPATRDQLVTSWGLDPAAISVVAPGVHRPPAAVDAAPTLARLGLAARGYVLAVGALEPRKAPLLLAGAFARARARGLTAELVFAGAGRLAPALAGDGVRVLGQVTDAELEALYAGAVALAMPSLLEGYGLPVREALARGLPAVVSDLPVFGAELSAAVLRVPVGDEAALADALMRLGGEAGLRDRLALAAPAAVAGLTWRAAARATRALLARACGGEPG